MSKTNGKHENGKRLNGPTTADLAEMLSKRVPPKGGSSTSSARKRRTGAAETRRPLAVLNEEERRTIAGYEMALSLAVELMKRGQQEHWQRIVAKYKLPPEGFEYRPSTGEILPDPNLAPRAEATRG